MVTTVPVYIIDAFTDQPFRGNPAGVVLLEKPASDAWMQNVAMEMNQAETAFVVPAEKGYHLRWFTPTVEVDLCGHATLAAASILWRTHKVPKTETISFHTKSGWLHCTRQEETIQLDFPARKVEPCEAPLGMILAMHLSDFTSYSNGMDYLIEVKDEGIVRAIEPDFVKLAQVSCRGVIVTSPSSRDTVEFVSRFFAPSCGIQEDPVTGSAHCALGPYWAEKLGKTRLRGFQASKRGGYEQVELQGDRV
ncbi:MAG TPA: PhzF family phenazine biosynthesis protein, partial [Gemmatales bacterium]|nr:PhzF family phenazine biosynthesis protein [Gemmatales bacterium]